ncbi:MAG: hypothetical protein O7G85_11565 [Planctomycetota bacterium]|nr:hypothetical protein [Planctomycetota bacterium]
MTTVPGCKSPEEAPPPPPKPSRLPNPPRVNDVTLGRSGTKRVDDFVNIVLEAIDGHIPMSWAITGLPNTWERTTTTEGRSYILTGKLPLGSSAQGVDIVAHVTDSNGRRSQPLPVHINVQPRSYEFQPTVLEVSDEGMTREFELQLRAIPGIDPNYQGRIEIWVDTTGLSDSAETGPDSLRIYQATAGGLDMTQPIVGTRTATGIQEEGELFVLDQAGQIASLADGDVRLIIKSHSNSRFRIFMIKVTAY